MFRLSFLKLTQLFFFISLFKVSSSFPPLLAIEGKAELKAACMLEVFAVADEEDEDDNFLELMEKSCTSLKSIAPDEEADFINSAIFILGKLEKRIKYIKLIRC